MKPGEHERKLLELLKLKHQPVAVSFRDDAPSGVDRIQNAAPAGCSYWKIAAEGKTFYTEAADHYNCPIGAYTHGVALPEEKSKELESVMGMMVNLKYITMEEVPQIPHRTEPLSVAVYSPLSQAASEPDVILVRGNPKQVMLLAEAARASGIGQQGEVMGRPACSIIPNTLATARGNTSLGCIGNRVYTGLEDDELYFAFPGSKVDDVVTNLETILRANQELEKFHRARAVS